MKECAVLCFGRVIKIFIHTSSSRSKKRKCLMMVKVVMVYNFGVSYSVLKKIFILKKIKNLWVTLKFLHSDLFFAQACTYKTGQSFCFRQFPAVPKLPQSIYLINLHSAVTQLLAPSIVMPITCFHFLKDAFICDKVN